MAGNNCLLTHGSTIVPHSRVGGPLTLRDTSRRPFQVYSDFPAHQMLGILSPCSNGAETIDGRCVPAAKKSAAEYVLHPQVSSARNHGTRSSSAPLLRAKHVLSERISFLFSSQLSLVCYLLPLPLALLSTTWQKKKGAYSKLLRCCFLDLLSSMYEKVTPGASPLSTTASTARWHQGHVLPT